jgi:uncharacterized protein YbjT (DUF2867 family)
LITAASITMPETNHAPVALIAGATGAVGRALLDQLLQEGRFGLIKVLTRRPLGLRDSRVQELLFTGDDPTKLGAALAADAVFCCLGTTIAVAGSKAAFERVDYHLVLELARACKQQGAQQFLVVSAVGSSARSLAFYSRVKARMEESVRELAYASTSILRPSLLIAKRAERRLAEEIGQRLAPLLNPLLRGELAKYRAVRAEDVAAAMVQLAKAQTPGATVHYLPL